MKVKHLFFLTLMLLMGSVQRAVADDNRPRIILPTLDIDDGTIGGSACITEKHPYFTVYVWCRNCDHVDSYWESAPTLSVDGRKVTLSFMSGDHGWKDSKDVYQYVCWDGDKVYYTVRTRPGFEVNDLFFTKFPKLKDFSNTDQDGYVPVDIYMHENHPGDVHTVSVRGNVHTDDGNKDLDAWDLDGNTSVLTLGTKCPTTLIAADTDLKWKTPGKLTFTSARLNELEGGWGGYRVGLEDKVSERVASGTASVTKEYSNPNYKEDGSYTVSYRYEGVYDPENPQKQYNENGTGEYWFVQGSFFSANNRYYWGKPDNCYMTFSRDIDCRYIMYYDNNPMTITLHAGDKRFCKVEVVTGARAFCSWEDWTNPQETVTLTTPGKGDYFTSIRVTFDRSLAGYSLEFVDTAQKGATSLPYPANLSASGNVWNKNIRLTWSASNANVTNRKGTWNVYRDNQLLTQILGDVSYSNFSYDDENVEYDKWYNYSVYFQPDGWDGVVSELSASTGTSLNRTISLSGFTVQAVATGYQLNWSIGPELDRSGYVFDVYRKVVTAENPNISASDYTSADKIGSVKVDNAKTLSYSYTDENISTTATYAYMVKIDNIQESSVHTNPTIPDGRPNASQIEMLIASHGSYTDHVHLEWQAMLVGDDYLVYDIYRHQVGEGENSVTSAEEMQQLQWIKVASLTSTKSAPVTTYDDYNATPGYYYAYAVIARANGSNEEFTRKMTDAFVRSTGTVYGSITYQNGDYAVEGVKVTLQSDATTSQVFNALQVNGGKSGVLWTVPEDRKNYFTGQFSAQMYVEPEAELSDGTCLLDMGGKLRLSLGNYNEAGYLLMVTGGSESMTSAHRMQVGQYTHLTLTYDGSGNVELLQIANDSLVADTFALTLNMGEMGNIVSVATQNDTTATLKGCIDDVRFFNYRLLERDVKLNYNHFLGGTEDGLVVYWTFDEGVSDLRNIYDYSKTGEQQNNNDAKLIGGVRSNQMIPSPDQLSLFGMTDTKGAYTVSGIPFMGVGTTYSIIPTKGVHKFNPTKRTVYVSPTTLTFDPQNFEDQSSFNVSGVVYYENTTYPVKDCTFRVDDVIVKDERGNVVKTDAEGKFSIPVSIGDHVLYVEKKGHTFLNAGRYPETGTYNFNDSVSHLTFTDLTKAIVVGRVVGGAEEKVKPLGFGASKANIGAATLTLLTSSTPEDARRMNVYLDKDEGTFESNPDTLFYELASDRVSCQAWAGGTKDGVDQEKYITIKTDPKSGEFAVLLPPAPYYISTRVDNNAEASAYFSDKVLLDCSNVLDTISSQLVLAKDTLGNVTESLTFKYNVGFSQTYMATPVITVEQTDNSVGAFGDEIVPAGELGDSVMAYMVQNDTVTYKYGYPIFTGGYKYNFKISSFERYMNYDGGVAESEREQRVPTTTGYLTLNNPWVAADADTLDRVRLDSLGTYTYSFQPIEPNLVPPYTQPLSIRLDVGNNTYSWDWKNGDYEGTLQGIVFSSKVTGNTSVTKAPDKIVNILPDPFGSNSNQVWKAGSSHNLGFKLHVQGAVTLGSDIMNETGSEVEIAEGAPGLYIYSGMSLEGGRGKGLSWKGSLDTDGGVSWQFATEEDFATSTSPYYDGPKGDLFIGVSTSLIYGDGMEVRLMDQQDGTYAVGTREVICTGEQIGTEFAYTQDHIINHLIPNYKRLREARLREVSTDSLKYYQEHFRNLSDSVIYMTDILPSDPRYGTNNDDSLAWGDEAIKDWKLKYNADSTCYYGPSYTAFLPVNKTYKNEEEIWDAILTINSDIQLWEYYLISNEFRKVMAFQDNDNLKKTYSFDSGSGVTYSNTTGVDSNESLQLSSNLNHYRKLAMEFEGNNGVVKEMKGSFNLTFDLNGSAAFVAGTHSSDTYVVNLSDPTPDNFHEVQIYELDSKGYIFRQTDGQTSQCYEGEERTKYYFPDQYILSAATVQIETPQIDCDEPVQTGVPIGEPAVFKLKLTNPTLANVTRRINFALMAEDDKWGQMSELTINGAANAHNYEVSMAPGETFLVTLKVKPYDLDVVHIDSLHMTFYSQGEPSISDDIYLSAHFQPAAEPVTLASSRTLVNTATDSTLVLTAAGYSINSSILNAVRLQQRKVGAPDWTTIHSWVKGVPSGSNESALTETIDTLVDMHSGIAYPDAEYEFRAVTDCTVGSEHVLGESNIIQVIKDVTLPKPIYLPEPADGVLGEGDNITLTFNEDIYSQSLTDVDNFIIQSVLNTDSVAHDVALRLDGSSEPAAKSQSKLTLGGTSFTLCGWVKTDGADGTFYQHGEGSNYFSVNIDADGYVAFEMKDTLGNVQTYKAKEALPKSTWSYLAVIYDHQAGTITAHAAHGDQEQNLMVDIPVSPITAEGNIYLGQGLKGAMHEVSLFSAALTWTTVKAQMYIGKSSATPSILGYWRLDEGHGTKSEDRARSRHMILSSANGWYMENANISLGLDTNSGVAIPMGGLSVGDNDSYLVEMWAHVDEESSDAELMRLDIGNKLDLMLDDGKLCLVANYNIYPTNKALNDAQWHHVALNVLKGAGGSGASLLVDGVAVLSNLDSDNIPSLAGAKLHLGQHMKGELDEVRLWHGTNTAETINERMYYRIDGKNTPGLVGYWPMETTYYDEYDQRVYSFSLDNMGYEATASTTLVADSVNVTLAAGTSAPGLKVAPHKSNLDFSFVADERTVSVTLDHSPEALEGCTVFTTLRSYYDLHTNVGNPITWSFVVKQNSLSWNTDEIDYSVLAGQEGTFTATLYNNGPADQSWSFSELPSWLEASPSSGTIFAHGSKEVTFTVKAGNSIGKYFSTVNVRGKLGIDTPLDICLSVEGKKPDWTPTVYGESMIVIGQIKFDGIISNDPNDIVAAFNEYEECVGVGQPAYYASTDAYYVFLYVYGTKKMAEEKMKLTFRLYDASTGSTYPLTKDSQDIIFASDSYVGTINNPVIWENDAKVLQTLALNENYNWVSLYLIPTHNELSQVFSPVANQISSVELADATYYYDDITHQWLGNAQMDAGMMAKVQMKQIADLYVAGQGVNPAMYPITIEPGNNWVGVPSTNYMTVDEAFAGLQPEEFDIVKSQTAFSQYINGKWFGNLDFIEPGKGYIYTSQADGAKTFTFPGDVPEHTDTVWSTTPGIKANFRYPHNMAVTCTVYDEEGHPLQASHIEAYDNEGELRGRSIKNLRDGLYLLVISGKTENEPLMLKAVVPERADDDQPTTILNFRKDTHLGNYHRPFVIGNIPTGDLATGFDANSTLAVYTTSGTLVYNGPVAGFRRQQLHADRVLIVVETTADGQARIYKLK